MVREKAGIDEHQNRGAYIGVEEREDDARWYSHDEEQRCGDNQRDRDSSMLDARILHHRGPTQMNQMIDHAAIESYHQQKRYTIVDCQLQIVPQWKNLIVYGIGGHHAVGFDVASKGKKVSIVDGEDDNNASDDNQNTP